MRGAAWVLTLFVLVGCSDEPSAPVCEEQAPGFSSPPLDECSAAAPIDPSEVTDLATYRELASALVCEWSLQCGGAWILGQSYCHPGFAAHEARGLSVDFEPARGRQCLEDLRSARTCDEAWGHAYRCRMLSLSNDADLPPDAPEGGACGPGPCAPGLSCVQGRCARLTASCGCASDEDCAAGQVCELGVCRRPAEVCGPSCGVERLCDPAADGCSLPPGPGEACAGSCLVGLCIEGVCVTQRGIGCACESDSECPFDVARCVEGRCAARPMEGEACEPLGAPCFASLCYDGVCGPIREGDGPCYASNECASGLVCPRRAWTPGTCEPARQVGEPCRPVLSEQCARGLHCHEARRICAEPAARGESCGDLPCEPNLRCVNDVCTR